MDPVLAEPLQITEVLARHDVEFVIIGGVAAILLGSPIITYDFDICYRRTRENTVRLADALREIQAWPRGFDRSLPFVLDGVTLHNGDTFTFETTLGPFDCLGSPSGTTGYDDLVRAGTTVDLGEGLQALVCSLDDLIRMKRAAGRAKDLIAIEQLIAIKQVRDGEP